VSDWGVSGIQQVGIGVADIEVMFRWCRKTLGMDIPVFRDEGRATLMTRYTGNVQQERRAVLAANLRGGGGLEIWQFTARAPRASLFTPQLGDLGIFLVRIKTDHLEKARAAMAAMAAGNGVPLPGPVHTGPGERHFFSAGPAGLYFELVEAADWFGRRRGPTGGVCGCMIGVSDIGRSLSLYSEILGYKYVISDAEGRFDDVGALPGGDGKMRRVVLAREEGGRGAFGRLLGSSSIELVQSIDRTPRRIFEGRYWGDLGFIHLCFDVWGMDGLRRACEASDMPFTVDSADAFDMGEAAGRFAYIEDPDRTLIEFVQPYRVGILPSLGWYLDLRNRDPRQPLPDALLKAMALKRVRGR
jgi:catechol 2,3-dioxygenase-like lactoylglutathione lyase family enzyme